MALFEGKTRDFQTLRERFLWDVPEHFNIGVDVCDRHAVGAERPALHLENAARERRTVTFGELKTRSDQLGNVLLDLGVERGDRIGIVLAQRLETALAHIAIYKTGAVAVPLSILFGRDALRYRLADSGAKVVFCGTAHVDMLETIRAEVPTLRSIISCDQDNAQHRFWDLLAAASDVLEAVDTRADDPALLIYTSGTTGPPKGSLGAHRCLLGNLPGFVLSQNFFPREGDLMYTPADWAWTGGLLDGLLPSLHFGVPVLGYDGGRFDAEVCFELMARHEVRNAFIPPTALKLMMQVPDPLSRHPLRLRSLMSAGEQLGPEVLGWAEEVLGVTVNEMWGQTEFNYLVGNCSEIMPVRPGSMGRPYPGHEVEVIDEAGRVAPTGEIGELAARRGDPVMFLGYWHNDAATQEKFTGDWFRTGDLGYRDEDGYLWFVGRKDDVISSAGHRVGPGEVEDCLLKHPAVAEAAVVGKADALRGQIIKAFIVLAEGHNPSQNLIEDIQESVRTRLAAYEYPREIEFIDALPMTTSGKIRRIELRDRG
jgi:acetyl-CoA synthetase